VSHIITTVSGASFDYDAPSVDHIPIEDIATALAHSARFAGHTRTFHSVAAHAVTVCRILEATDHDALDCYAGLHHDDHEGFLTDLPTPLKQKFNIEGGGLWAELANDIDATVAKNLGIDPSCFYADDVVWADGVALRLESSLLRGVTPIPRPTTLDLKFLDLVDTSLSHDEARNDWLAMHYELAPAAGGQRR
jgi:hypothetical protein